MNELKFKTIREANITRLPRFKNSKGELAHSEQDGSDWSPAQWLQAVVGELGEYANKRKKFERGDICYEEFIQEAKSELADVFIYLDILAYQFRIDLGQAVLDKFNGKSEEFGIDVFITGESIVVDGKAIGKRLDTSALRKYKNRSPVCDGVYYFYDSNGCYVGDYYVRESLECKGFLFTNENGETLNCNSVSGYWVPVDGEIGNK